MSVGGELLIPKHRQPLFQAELEPVATGHPVTGPIVKVFMRDDRLDALKIYVGRGFTIGQDITAVEDVKALVLHRPHVEMADRNDHEQVEVIFQAEPLLVPGH